MFGNPDGTFRDLEYEEVKNMPVMDSCIREALRLVSGHPMALTYTFTLPNLSVIYYIYHLIPHRSLNYGADEQHAPIHSIYRKVISPITVPPSLASPSESSSYIIPTSHYMLAAPGVSAMDPRIWPDAEIWNPSRWTDEKGAGAEASELYTAGEQVDYGYGMVSKGTESPYQPFGAGRHRCVGEQFAYMQLSTIISYIVRHYTLRLETPGREFPKTDYNVSLGS
jgi:sterol 14-demethylase